MDFLFKINDFQKTKRYGHYPSFWESDSEHTFKLVLMVDYFYHELKLDLDYKKCIQLALYHDFGEMDMVTDYDAKEGKDASIKEIKRMREKEKIDELAERYYGPIREYFQEYQKKETMEAKFVNACDKIDGAIHPLTVDDDMPNEVFFATYADKAILDFPPLLPFYKEIKEETKKHYLAHGLPWKEEYEHIFVKK